jgi:hypothetical protein
MMTGNRAVRATIYGLLMALACFVLTYDLGDRLMWGDEADTALRAVNITKYGVPRVEDGKNRIILHGRTDANEAGLWVYSPWLDEYVTAGAFILFGKSTVAARLPFALIGLASVALLGLFTHRVYRDHRIAMAAMLLYVTCVPFLLHARQCRYYAILMLAQIWLMWGYHRILEGSRVNGAIQVALGLAIQFYCNYMVLPGNLLGMGLASLMLCRRHPGLIKSTAAAIAGTALLAAPWLVYSATGRQLKSLELLDFQNKAAFHLAKINDHIFPLALLLIPLLLAGVRLFRTRCHKAASPHAITSLLWLLLASQLLCLSILPFKYFRYMTPMIPVIVILGAGILMVRLKPIWLGISLVVIVASTNIFSIAGAALFGEFRSPGFPFARYVRSVTSEYTDRLEDAVAFLLREGGPDQTIFSPGPEFPLIFYTDMRVLDGRYRKLVVSETDWIAPVSVSRRTEGGLSLRIPPYIEDVYEKVTLSVHASPRGGSRPDPDHYAFFTVPQLEQLVFYKKRPRPVELQP